MADNMEIWNSLKRPPKEALKPINFGALKGKSDIDPVWRDKAMTSCFGPCGVGWYFDVDKLWSEPAPNDCCFAFAQVSIYYKMENGEWSKPVRGVGGNMLVKLGNGVPRENDEGYKMAITDAVGTAMRKIGVAADIYEGKFDGAKYVDEPTTIVGEDLETIKKMVKDCVTDLPAFLRFAQAKNLETIPVQNKIKVLNALNKKMAEIKRDREPGEDG